MKFIYCAGGGIQYSTIAMNNGYLYGARLPVRVDHDLYFADQNWKDPDFGKYVTAIKKHRPKMATVLDWEKQSQKEEVFKWAETIAPYVDNILFIPKFVEAIEQIPYSIGQTKVTLAYSVPTRYGKSLVPIKSFSHRDIHLLGGSPHGQMSLYLENKNIISVDGNYHQKMAAFNKVWVWGAKRVLGRWVPLEEHLGYKVEIDSCYVAFDISCKNIMKAWKEHIL
jgi:hypothetical protein